MCRPLRSPCLPWPITHVRQCTIDTLISYLSNDLCWTITCNSVVVSWRRLSTAFCCYCRPWLRRFCSLMHCCTVFRRCAFTPPYRTIVCVGSLRRYCNVSDKPDGPINVCEPLIVIRQNISDPTVTVT